MFDQGARFATGLPVNIPVRYSYLVIVLYMYTHKNARSIYKYILVYTVEPLNNGNGALFGGCPFVGGRNVWIVNGSLSIVGRLSSYRRFYCIQSCFLCLPSPASSTWCSTHSCSDCRPARSECCDDTREKRSAWGRIRWWIHIILTT